MEGIDFIQQLSLCVVVVGLRASFRGFGRPRPVRLARRFLRFQVWHRPVDWNARVRNVKLVLTDEKNQVSLAEKRAFAQSLTRGMQLKIVHADKQKQKKSIQAAPVTICLKIASDSHSTIDFASRTGTRSLQLFGLVPHRTQISDPILLSLFFLHFSTLFTITQLSTTGSVFFFVPHRRFKSPQV